jgi:hypothetical protein
MKPVRPASVSVTPKNLKIASAIADVRVFHQVLVDEDRQLVLRVTLWMGDTVAREGAEHVAAWSVERDRDVGEVGLGIRGTARVGDHAAIDAGVHRLVPGVLLGIRRIQLLEGRRVRRPRLPFPDRQVGRLAEDLFGLLQVHARQLDDDPVLALWPDDRFRVAAAVDAALDDRDRDVAGCRGRDP